MANSERSFADRLQKGRVLLAALQNMSPAFVPADAALSIGNFEAYLDSVGGANDAVASGVDAFSEAVTARVADAKKAQALVTQVVAYVKSNSAWKLKFPRIKQLGDKIRGIRPPRRTAPRKAAAPGAPAAKPEKKRDRGDQSYADIASNFKAFATAVAGLSGYNPPDAGITGPALTALGKKLEKDNTDVASTDQALDEAQRARADKFAAPETGLEAKFQAEKNAVKGQYSQKSPQWNAVKAMRW